MHSYSITKYAENDLDELANFIAKDNLESALNLYGRAKITFRNLAENPKMGMKYQAVNPELKDIRFFPMNDFPKYLVFYSTWNNKVKVIRVLHYARDINEILKLEKIN